MAKIVFMGDSIIAYMPYFFKGTIGNDGDEVKYVGAENIGVGTYMNYWWPNVECDDVDFYVLLIGTNNISRPDCDYDKRESLEELINKLKEFIDKISSSNAKLFVQSIYPTKYIERLNKIKKVNEQIKAYCFEKGIEYLDIYSLLIDDNEFFNSDYSNDGIHPNELGYSVVADEINKRLKSVCKKLI